MHQTNEESNLLGSTQTVTYNGYTNNNDGEVYLAKKPEFIKLFAIFIAMNCFGCGGAWLLYALLPKCCHGLKFKLSIFIVDQCADVFYSIFPFLAIMYDEYNEKWVEDVQPEVIFFHGSEPERHVVNEQWLHKINTSDDIKKKT